MTVLDLPSRGLGALLFAAIASLGLSACGDARADAQSGSIRPDAINGHTVVELFQSQGCSSCPPANANINALADRKDLIVLSFGVTYWDYLGWRDSFARPEFTQRQKDFAESSASDGIYTPQVVLNGRKALVGANRGLLESSILRAGKVAMEPIAPVTARTVRIDARPGQFAALVWLVRFDPGNRDVAIRAGENNGRTLPHRHVVRELVKLGQWHGKAAEYALPQPREKGLASVILLQAGTGGPILAARPI